MSILLASAVTVTAPSASDGFGQVAVFNNTASSDFVGWLWKISGFGGPGVRSSMDDIPEGHGSVFGDFFHGHRPFTMEVMLAPSTSYALSDARYNKLCRAWNAMADDGSIVWTDTDTIAKRILFRREQPPSDPAADRMVLLAGVAASPRIEASTPTTGSSPQTNAGDTAAPPTFTLTPTGGNVVITNTTAGLGSPAVTLRVGGDYLSTGSAVTVDFSGPSITQGGVRRDDAELFPDSTWWGVILGANTWTVTNASSVSISFRSSWLSA